MTHEDIVVMCEKLAGKYKRQDMTDDLVSEGVLAVYERLEVNPDDYPASLYKKANKAMYDYLNISCKPVTIPKTRTAESILKGASYKGQTHSERGKEALEEALTASSVSFEENYDLFEQDTTEAYERHDFLKKGFETLSDRERQVIIELYLQEKSQVELAGILGVSHTSVQIWEQEALYKMNKV